ncbi:MAG: hypothetical protein CVV03_04010 [Firmicutes bacterium HGW-Firmicutes-8]|nr:MAG: hypothetical protein CVV03_04010 [Firmicutes bacterium HGW-Firmicutes-8]
MSYPDERSTRYFYDPADRLVEVDLPQDKVVIYDYDYDGNRIMKMATKSPVKDFVYGKEAKEDKGNKGKSPENAPGQQKAKKQRADLQYLLLSNGGGGNSGGNNGNQGDGNNGNGGGNDKDKSNNGKGQDGKADNGQGYKGKGCFENIGKHLGWYKNGKYGEMPQNPELIETTYYLNDVADPLTQVLMTYDEKDNYKAAYAYGLERFEVQALDNTRPESQDPLYYLHDGLGSVSQLTRPNEIR